MSALRLIAQLRPDWQEANSEVSFVRFTDGITNTLLKATCRLPDTEPSAEDADADAILLRAYGNGTDVIIDRQREAQNHELLGRFGLAPELLARFENGMLYRFIRGTVTQPDDLRRPEVYCAVARRLAQWHATVPCLQGPVSKSGETKAAELQRAIDRVAAPKPSPNVWTVMQKWIFALPTKTEEQKARQENLQTELKWLVRELSQREGLGKDGLVFAHCDLLSGNIILLPKPVSNGVNGSGAHAYGPNTESVAFIDYEYATPSPAAFDIANHFAEWGGFDCDYSVLPTCSQRRTFIHHYIRSYFELLPDPCRVGATATTTEQLQSEADKLFEEVDLFRGVPGFYWGIWALIQATISEIDFDYASYAETRLGEYWAWREEAGGTRKAKGLEMPLRERRWAQE